MARQRFQTLRWVTVWLMLLAWSDAGAAPLKLELKLQKGKTFYQRTVTDQKITQTLMGQQQVIDQSMGNAVRLDVLDVDRQGNMRVRHTFTWLLFKQTNPMGNTEYDSSKQATVPVGSEALAALLGESYVVQISPAGQVLDINGVEELAETVRKKLPPGGEQSQTMMIVATYIEKARLKETLDGMLAFYPDKPVNQGEAWQEKMSVTVGLGMITDFEWTLQKREGGVATVRETAGMRSNPDAPPLDAGGLKMKFDVSGTQEGTMRVDEATGLLLTSQGQQQLKGEIKVAMSAEAPPIMAIPAVLETTFKVETSEKMWEPPSR